MSDTLYIVLTFDKSLNRYVSLRRSFYTLPELTFARFYESSVNHRNVNWIAQPVNTPDW